MGIFDGIEVGKKNDYLNAGEHVVTVRKIEVKTGDDARPAWATHSLSVMFGNDEGVTFGDVEIAPLEYNGELSERSLTFCLEQLTNLGLEVGDPDSVQALINIVTDAVFNGTLLGNKVLINITEKASTKTNPHTGEPYKNRRVFINKFLERGTGESGVDAVVDEFDAAVF